jgi:hypothetical protein
VRPDYVSVRKAASGRYACLTDLQIQVGALGVWLVWGKLDSSSGKCSHIQAEIQAVYKVTGRVRTPEEFGTAKLGTKFERKWIAPEAGMMSVLSYVYGDLTSTLKVSLNSHPFHFRVEG